MSASDKNRSNRAGTYTVNDVVDLTCLPVSGCMWQATVAGNLGRFWQATQPAFRCVRCSINRLLVGKTREPIAHPSAATFSRVFASLGSDYDPSLFNIVEHAV